MNWKNAFTITLTGNYDPLYLNRVDFIFLVLQIVPFVRESVKVRGKIDADVL